MQLSSNPLTGGWLTGYSTKSTRLSREKPIAGKMRGIFTTALLAGLGGGAAEPSGDITAESLSNYLYEHMKDWLNPAELSDPDIAQRPDMLYDRDPASRFVITSVIPRKYLVVVRPSVGSVGQALSIRNGAFLEVFQQQQLTNEDLTLDLPQGFYLAQLLPEGRVVTFRVPAKAQEGSTDVAI